LQRPRNRIVTAAKVSTANQPNSSGDGDALREAAFIRFDRFGGFGRAYRGVAPGGKIGLVVNDLGGKRAPFPGVMGS